MVSALASSSLAEERKKEDSEKLKALVRDCDLLEEDKNQRECEMVVFQERKGSGFRPSPYRMTHTPPHRHILEESWWF